MSELLTDVDVRVLGSLIEKEQTTPEYYPLSLNALVNACNQSSNRDPVVKYDESTVTQSIDALRKQGLVRATKGIDARVTKYAHRMGDVLGLKKPEIALLCVLMLRGAQTPGELRTRTERFASFADLAEVESTLEGLMPRELVIRLPRQPGQKEVRYAQLLTGKESAESQAAVQGSPRAMPTPTASVAISADRVAALEERVEGLRKELADLRTQVEAFRSQFE